MCVCVCVSVCVLCTVFYWSFIHIHLYTTLYFIYKSANFTVLCSIHPLLYTIFAIYQNFHQSKSGGGEESIKYYISIIC